VSLVGTVAWAMVANRTTVRTPARAVPSPSSGRSSAPSPSPSPCALAVTSPAVRCAATAECFGQLGKDHRAAAVGCEQPHAWEVFAVGTLPDSLQAVDYDSLRKTQAVRAACTATTLALVDFNAYAWKVDVVGPTLDAYRHGDRAFRCVAGPASGMVTGSTFTRR
jgi:hypothetical protein